MVRTSGASTRSGYALVATAAALWGLNGSLVRLQLDAGFPVTRIAQLRAVSAALALFVAFALRRPQLLRVSRSQLTPLACYGVLLAAGDATTFVAIRHLDVAVALLVQCTAPLVLLTWLRLVHGRRLPPRLWLVGLAVVGGCFLLVRAYEPSTLSLAGLAAAAASAVTLACVLVLGERLGRRHDPLACTLWGVVFTSLFWLVVAPPWSFPLHSAGRALVPLLLGCALSSFLPACLLIVGLQRVSAARAAMVATLEPVIGAVCAYLIFGQTLSTVQLLGATVIVLAVATLQRAPIATSELTP